MSDLRHDTFELGYVLNWLTAVISKCSDMEEEEYGDGEDWGGLVEEASRLLALCAGTASAGTFQRVFDFQSESLGGVQVVLRDVPLDNDDYGSVGAQTWGGACVLSEMVVEDPGSFGLALQGPDGDNGGKPLRVLELGAGTGLVSLVVAKALQGMGVDAEIVASDYYPSVLANLSTNLASNGFGQASEGRLTCSAHALDWSLFPSDNSAASVFEEPFDLVFGADIIYEAQHAEWIRDCLERLLAKPTPSSPDVPLFHLLIPLRHTHAAESETIETVFPPLQSAKEDILRMHSKELITCDTDSGEEVVYAYYKIGW
ncbi:putative methyltransferase-domain-containing protein [Ephemerocybe angulata]|uniref:Putative methyltransferase-domain-containing protein n=1 Tax=Ephemerocybe angulata TaxID=980116 RepID=A0A8H6H5P1_9AGAR|nr:putative methyltransferase-domain-containing protein [Tulosesus angulatus]